MTAKTDASVCTQEFDFRKMNEEIYGSWNYTIDFDIDHARTALVIVDMQTAFIDPNVGMSKGYAAMIPGGTDYYAQRVKTIALPNNQKVLAACRDLGIKVIHIVTWSETQDLSDMPEYQHTSIRRMEKAIGEQVYRKWNEGMDVCPELAPRDDEPIVAKRTGSGFISSMLPYILRNAGIDTVILTGVNTNGCVFETAVGGRNLGFKQILVSDCTACFDPMLQEEAEVWINRCFATVMSTNQVIKLLHA